MRQVLLTALESELGGPGALSRGIASFEYWAGSGPYASVDGATVTLPRTITVAIEDGQPVEALELEETGDLCCIRMNIVSLSTGLRLERYVTIPAGVDPIAFGDLPIVDPDTFAPVDLTPTLQQTIESIARELLWDKF